MDDLNLWLVGGGLFLGLLFGVVVQRTQFCMITAVSNVVLMRDFRHAHAYFAALLVAILGTHYSWRPVDWQRSRRLDTECHGMTGSSLAAGDCYSGLAACWLEVVPGERRYGRQRGIWEPWLCCLPLH